MSRAKTDNPEAGILENFSKKAKGRPRLISGEMAGVIRYAASDPNATPRSLQNKFYQLRAIRVLGLTCDDDMPEHFRWLWNPDSEKQTCKTRWTILAELGRISDDEIMIQVARDVCKQKLKTHEAVVLIRRFRLGGTKPGDADTLGDEIGKCVDNYLRRHPELSYTAVLDALSDVYRLVQTLEEGARKAS